jgi:hypothetical protein
MFNAERPILLINGAVNVILGRGPGNLVTGISPILMDGRCKGGVAR